MTPLEVAAFVGLGSNLDRPLRQVQEALRELDRLPRTRLVSHSRLYQSPPLGPPDQPHYVNAVALLNTALDAHALLDQLQAMEQRHGRERGERWGARTLDLDLLLYGERQIASARLTVPHPELHRRAFVLVPLADIAPDLHLPGLGSLRGLLDGVATAELRPVEAGRDD